MNSELNMAEKYVHALLIFSWSDTCWEHKIWRIGTFSYCYEYEDILQELLSMARAQERVEMGVSDVNTISVVQ